MSNRIFPNHQVTFQEISLVPAAFFQLLIARLKVSFLKAEKYLPKSSSRKASNIPLHTTKSTENIAKAVNGVAVRTPWSSTCLVRSLAAHKMLAKKNIPHTFHLGVQKTIKGEIIAHAWISVAGKVIIGGDEAGRFREISQVSIA